MEKLGLTTDHLLLGQDKDSNQSSDLEPNPNCDNQMLQAEL